MKPIIAIRTKRFTFSLLCSLPEAELYRSQLYLAGHLMTLELRARRVSHITQMSMATGVGCRIGPTTRLALPWAGHPGKPPPAVGSPASCLRSPVLAICHGSRLTPLLPVFFPIRILGTGRL